MPGDKSDLKLDWASHKAALYACKHWHYSKNIPKTKLFKVGVWEENEFKGVIIFSRGASPFLFTKYALNQSDGCELTRIALKKHIFPISRMVSIAIKLLKDKNPGLKLIVSFADEKQGHYGGIYQAGNWIYTGKSPEVRTWIIGNSKKRWHERAIGLKFGTTMQSKIPNSKIVIDPGKHRYLMPITKEMREKILPLAKPYPKACKAGDDPDQGNSDGATPICTLQG